ncbi:hypothetical protein CspeluHIS016_0114240 [Cutaneotrichosporon spelunceum]|uniref:Thioesterase domain-containing protein n=1 Tax=Cutaneotrichosporon spelunceum TaxID=1672016 RepID=A0AAD3TPX9_9TREE|nr:hypothetical protein CspeluHIS016_0114240 [Cutaneotrichosporon spelunceum]
MQPSVPFTPADVQRSLGILRDVGFANSVHRAPVAIAMDPLPPVNARGGRTVPPEGWRAVYMVVVGEDMCNHMKNLHGGAAATLVDTVTSVTLALLATDSFWGYPMISGVTAALDMTYYDAAPLGTKMRLTCTVEHAGGALANLRGELTDWDTGKPYASGTHIKTWRDLRPKSKPKAEVKDKAKM